jgi:hypothetical protein
MKKQKKKTYEYFLPKDTLRLTVDALVFSGIDAIAIGLLDIEEEMVKDFAERHAKDIINRMKPSIKTNDFHQFSKIFTENYVSMFCEKQKVYKKDKTNHKTEVAMAKSYEDKEFKARYRTFVEQTVMGGR